MTAKRPGRRLPLSGIQRRAVWSVHETLLRLLQSSRVETWHMARSRAERIFARNAHHELYDAVVIDEAQDLDPSILRMLIGLCRTPTGFSSLLMLTSPFMAAGLTGAMCMIA